MLALMGVYRDGWRRPLEAVELWEGLTLVATLSGAVLASMVAHAVEGARLERTVRRALQRPMLPQLRAVNGRQLRARRPRESDGGR